MRSLPTPAATCTQVPGISHAYRMEAPECYPEVGGVELYLSPKPLPLLEVCYPPACALTVTEQGLIYNFLFILQYAR